MLVCIVATICVTLYHRYSLHKIFDFVQAKLLMSHMLKENAIAMQRRQMSHKSDGDGKDPSAEPKPKSPPSSH